MSNFLGKTVLKNENETNRLGSILYKKCKLGDVITLSGSIGMGKTTIARSFILEGSNSKNIPSPTYNLVQTYDSSKGEIIHFDAWRLKIPNEVLELGILDSIEKSITIIEWPENIIQFIPRNHLNIKLLFKNDYRIAYFNGSENWKNTVNNVIN